MMKNISTTKFCEMYEACEPGRKFAENFETMREYYQALLNGEAGKKSAGWVVCVFCQRGAADERTQRLFAVWCARRAESKKPECIAAIDTAERFANGQATEAELIKARKVAYWAVDSAAYSAAFWAADNAAYSAADWAADRAADWAAFWAAYSAADWAAERQSQLEYLREVGNIFEAEAEHS